MSNGPNRYRSLPEGRNATKQGQTVQPDFAGSPLNFWAPHTGNYWLSNFFDAEVKYGDDVYPTSEHLYQALKCMSERDRLKIREAATPKKAKELGRKLGRNLNIPSKAYIMRVAIRAKFEQHDLLRAKLISSEGRIVEASPFDYLWGEGPRKCGLNLMGLLLSELREDFKANQEITGQ